MAALQLQAVLPTKFVRQQELLNKLLVPPMGGGFGAGPAPATGPAPAAGSAPATGPALSPAIISAMDVEDEKSEQSAAMVCEADALPHDATRAAAANTPFAVAAASAASSSTYSTADSSAFAMNSASVNNAVASSMASSHVPQTDQDTAGVTMVTNPSPATSAAVNAPAFTSTITEGMDVEDNTVERPQELVLESDDDLF